MKVAWILEITKQNIEIELHITTLALHLIYFVINTKREDVGKDGAFIKLVLNNAYTSVTVCYLFGNVRLIL